MKMSIKANYVLRILMDIALNQGKEITRYDYIATRQNISEKYAEYLLTGLKEVKIVSEGENGEIKLLKSAGAITLEEILELTEEEYRLIDISYKEKYPIDFDRIIKMQLWDEITKAVKRSIEKKTLKDLTDIYSSIYANNFYI